MKNCAFLSTSDLEPFFVYDTMLFEPLLNLGWQAEQVSWRDPDIDWNQYDLVVIRSTWDYQQDVEAFVSCLHKIDASSAILTNSLPIVEWNISKDYLQDLQNQGISIVPTLWFERFVLREVEQGFAHFACQQLVIKPLVSANADHTYKLSLDNLAGLTAELTEIFADRAFMLQPFLPAIVTEGEYSLFYFAGHYSHSILKQPKAGDFRVQEEHGGQLTSIEPSAEMLQVARYTLAALPADVLFARIDLIRHQQEFVVMEVELIEPSLYFNMDPQSPQRFADALAETFGVG
jgi:glutathione synthase/RimK-type ligase-like ATP-grasp enzyme